MKARILAVAAVAAAGAIAACMDSSRVAAPSAPNAVASGRIHPSLVTSSMQDSAIAATITVPDSVSLHGTATVTMKLTSKLTDPTTVQNDSVPVPPVDLVAVMDASGSIGEAGWNTEQDFVGNLAATVMGHGSRMGIVEFGTTVATDWTFQQTQSTSAIESAVASLPYLRGETYTKSAMRAALNIFAASPSSRPRVIALVTDGNPNPPTSQNPCNFSGAYPDAARLRDSLQLLGINTIIVGVGPDISANALGCLINQDPSRFIPVASFTTEAFNGILDQVIAKLTPTLSNVTLHATVAPGFTLGSGPTPTDTVLINGVDGSGATYDAATHAVTWSVPALQSVPRNLSLTLAPSLQAQPLCGLKPALTSVSVTYALSTGGQYTRLLPDANITVTKCNPPVVTPSVTGTVGQNGWYTSDVAVGFDVQSDSPLTSETGCSASTLTVDTADSTFTCTAANDAGSVTKSVTVKRDATPPVVAYSGNAGTYGASQDVAITCAATDATSGVASSTCANVSGAAWSIGVGSHSYSATATDNAGNVGSGSATFTVVVTVQDLDNLAAAWVSGPGANGVVNSLHAKLKGSSPNVQAFINEVQAQSGKKIPADKAAVLIALAQAM
ncbi:MAG TPA: vWA domain-containing protein [Gemmatimonadaceae bacterium]|nr:vWA domain-containing protein [Gemmatimonadaceae bacterium]